METRGQMSQEISHPLHKRDDLKNIMNTALLSLLSTHLWSIFTVRNNDNYPGYPWRQLWLRLMPKNKAQRHDFASDLGKMGVLISIKLSARFITS